MIKSPDSDVLNELANDLGGWTAALVLFQDLDDLLLGESVSHGINLLFLNIPCRNSN